MPNGKANVEGSRQGTGLLRRLARDKRGNTLAMMAALLIPLLGMVGSGLDMARGYMAKAKLQTACDAAATAARRVMGANAFSVDADADGVPDAKEEGERFFHFNFPNGLMNTPAVNLSIDKSATDASVIQVRASTNVPTEIMRIFGATTMPISVECSADKDYVNNDIMLVLDVTGSMNCRVGGATYCATEETNSRISKLRGAAVELYKALDDASGVRTRYGFMPYSITVNVGGDMKPDWLAATSVYHRRNCQTQSNAQYCSTWGTGNNWFTSSVARTSTQLQTLIDAKMNETINGVTVQRKIGFCLEERSSSDQTGTGIGTSGIRIGSGVTQADIDTVGSADRYRWQIYDPGQAYGTNLPFNANGTSFEQDTELQAQANLARFCPRPAARLATYASETAFQNALLAGVGRVNTTEAVGGHTNHDLGIMWGMRYLSGTGMFAADNPGTWDATADGVANPIRVDRHIVFLSDGDMTAVDNDYSAYGIPAATNGRRLTGTGTEVAKHSARFLNACNRARAMGFTVWVIALDSDAGFNQIKACATDANHAFKSNGTDLASVFQLIGKGIGKLRLVE